MRVRLPLRIATAFLTALVSFAPLSASGAGSGDDPLRRGGEISETEREAPPTPARQLAGLEQAAAELPQQSLGADELRALAAATSVEASVPANPAKLRPVEPHAVYNCVGPGGMWSNPVTWGAPAPTPADDVFIGPGCTVTIDVPSFANNVFVMGGGVLDWNPGVAVTLTTTQSVRILPGGIFRTNPAGVVTTHMLTVGGDLTNDGTLDFSTPPGMNLSAAGITFTGAQNAVFTGTGPMTNLKTLAVNKGTSRASVLELNPASLTVQNTVVDGAPMAFMTLTNGTLKISSNFLMTSRVFAGAALYTIPATAGFWLNNPNFVVAGQNASPINNGLLRISAGTFNVGTAAGDSVSAGVGASFAIEGGTLNVAGRLNSVNNLVTYSQSGGTVNVSTVGNAAATPSFGFNTGTGIVMNMSGGTINLVQAATTLDYNQGGTMLYTGGTLNVGTGATAGAFLFRIQGQMPAVVLDNTTNAKNANLSGQGNVWGNLAINPGTTLNLNPGTAQTLVMIGPTITNNGAIVVNTTNTSTVNFAGLLQQLVPYYAQLYTGAGTFGTALLRIATFTLQNPQGVTLAPVVPNLNIYRINAFYGQITNAGKLAIGAGDAVALFIQRGVGTSAWPGGSLDVAPIFNVGAGGLTLIYAQAAATMTTGPEIPATRTVLGFQVINPTGVTLAGGVLTITGTTSGSNGLVLSSGVLTTTVANLPTLTGTLTTAITGGSAATYVNGPLARVLPASLVLGSIYTFPVGKGSFKMLELVNPTTNAGGTVTVRAEVFDADSGGTAGIGLGAIHHDRYWSAALTAGAGNFTNTTIRLTEQGTTGVDTLGQSATQVGAYDSIGGGVLAPTIGASAAVTTLGFFAVGTVVGAPTLCGTYTVGVAGIFPTLTAAVAAWNSRLATCAVTFSLLDNVYGAETYPVRIDPNGGSSAANTLTIKPAAGATPAFNGSSATALLVLNGVDYVTIDGSNTAGGASRDTTFTNTNALATSVVIWGQTVGTADPVRNATLENLVVTGNSPTTTLVGIGFGSSTIGSASLGTRNDGNVVQNNRVTSVQFGVYSQGASSTNKNLGNVISGNTLGTSTGGLGRAGVYVGFEDGIQITNNAVTNVTSSVVNADTFGIALGSVAVLTTSFGTNDDVANAVVTGNSIGTVVHSNTYSAVGISFSALYGSNRIANNMISGVVSDGTAGDFCAGMFLGNSSNNGVALQVYANSVSMTGARDLAPGGNASYPSFALALFGTNPLVDLRDNILYNTQTATAGVPGGLAGSYAIGLSSVLPVPNLTSDFNDLYTSGASSHFAITGGLVPGTNVVEYSNLAAWRAATGKDASSISADPLFVSTTDLHIGTCAAPSPAENVGIPIGGVTIDFDGEARVPPTADIGADEILDYLVAASAGGGGSISPSGFVPVRKGCNLAFTITPAACNAISDVVVDGVSVGPVGNYTFTGVTANHTIVASFVAASYTITASAGAGGSITPSGSIPVACGASQGFTITPNPCSTISDVLVDGLSVGPVSSYTFLSVSANHTISASFTGAGLFSITATATAGGSVNPGGTQFLACGLGQSYAIVPAAGYTIQDVQVDGVSVGAVPAYDFTAVSSNHTIDAAFRAIVGTVPDRQSLGAPLLLRKNGGIPSQLDLTWGDSCGADQSDFAVYEGTLGGFYGHGSILGCTTLGAFSASGVTPAGANTYYLVVPLSASAEGSYGTDSSGNQIPTGFGVCRGSQDTACCPATNLVGYWKLDEVESGFAWDSSVNGLSGTRVSNPVPQVPGTSPIGSGNAMAFDPGYLHVSDSVLYMDLMAAMTIEAWIYDTDGADNTIVSRGGNDFAFQVHRGGGPGLSFYAANGSWTDSFVSIPTNQWVHVAMTWNGATFEVKFYVNGALASTHTRPGPIPFLGGVLNVGRENPNGCQCDLFTGTLDDVRIWKVVRTAAEIAANMGSPISCQ